VEDVRYKRTYGKLSQEQLYMIDVAGFDADKKETIMGREGCVQLGMTPIGQTCTCEPMTWLYFVLVQSVFVFVGQTRTVVRESRRTWEMWFDELVEYQCATGTCEVGLYSCRI
jgi:hypothetical protein